MRFTYIGTCGTVSVCVCNFSFCVFIFVFHFCFCLCLCFCFVFVCVCFIFLLWEADDSYKLQPKDQGDCNATNFWHFSFSINITEGVHFLPWMEGGFRMRLILKLCLCLLRQRRDPQNEIKCFLHNRFFKTCASGETDRQ